jgi:UDP-sugar pyrophosphorylase
MLFI